MKQFFGSWICVALLLLVACQPAPTLDITEPGDNVELRPKSSILFKASVTNGEANDIAWSDGDAGGSFEPSSGPETTYSVPDTEGAYTITASLRGAQDSQTVTVLAPLNINVELSVSGDGSSSEGLSGNITLTSGSSRVFQINVPAVSKEALIISLSQPLDMFVYNAEQALVASSSSADFFAVGSLGITKKLNTQGITVNSFCAGSCVYQSAKDLTKLFVEVRNTFESPVSFTIFAYAEDYNDTGEPTNDSLETAIPLSTSESGALEFLKDADYYKLSKAGTLSLVSSKSVVATRAELLSATGELIKTLKPGEKESVTAETIVKVFSSNNRAASPSVSAYTLLLSAVD